MTSPASTTSNTATGLTILPYRYAGRLAVLLMILLMVSSCGNQLVYEDNREIPEGRWISRNKLEFTAEITETDRLYDVYLKVRNSRDYPYSNLYMFLNTVYPDHRVSRDTLELTLADYDGRWLGSGMGNLKYSRFLFKSRVRFPQKGVYRFEFEQAMRQNELTGIHDLGMRIDYH